MQDKLNKPKRFGEVLDTIFSLSRSRFLDFLKIYLMLLGPIIILEVLVYLAMGKSLIQEVGQGSNWIEKILSGFDPDDPFAQQEEILSENVLIMLSGIMSVFATVAILFAVDHIRKGETFQPSEVAKRAFTKALPILGATILLIIAFFFLLLIILLPGSTFSLGLESLVSLTFFFLILGIGLIALLIYLIIKITFYIAEIAFGSTVLSSFKNSWQLTRRRVLFLFGLYIVFVLIIGIINFVFEITAILLLGNSVLYVLIVNIVALATSMIGSIGYSVAYFDLKSRHDVDEIQEIIEEYHSE